MKSGSRYQLVLLSVAAVLALAGCAAGAIGMLGSTLLALAFGVGLSACYASTSEPFNGLGDGGAPQDPGTAAGSSGMQVLPPSAGSMSQPTKPSHSVPPTPTTEIDQDGDGYPLSKDCNDQDPSINPGEVDNDPCDGVSYNCSPGAACNSFPEPGGQDLDGDGYYEGVDCNDNNPYVHPNIPDVPCDFVDNNCDGVQMACNPMSQVDNDRDGYPDSVDCNDNDYNVNPSAIDPNSCDGTDENCDQQEWACNAQEEDAGVEEVFTAPASRARR